jgi:hypothetical protein
MTRFTIAFEHRGLTNGQTLELKSLAPEELARIEDLMHEMKVYIERVAEKERRDKMRATLRGER